MTLRHVNLRSDMENVFPICDAIHALSFLRED